MHSSVLLEKVLHEVFGQRNIATESFIHHDVTDFIEDNSKKFMNKNILARLLDLIVKYWIPILTDYNQ